jgi:hypothetical protein
MSVVGNGAPASSPTISPVAQPLDGDADPRLTDPGASPRSKRAPGADRQHRGSAPPEPSAALPHAVAAAAVSYPVVEMRPSVATVTVSSARIRSTTASIIGWAPSGGMTTSPSASMS